VRLADDEVGICRKFHRTAFISSIGSPLTGIRRIPLRSPLVFGSRSFDVAAGRYIDAHDFPGADETCGNSRMVRNQKLLRNFFYAAVVRVTRRPRVLAFF
jgi:hypothetical protein